MSDLKSEPQEDCNYPVLRKGEAKIKKEFLKLNQKRENINLNFVSNEDKKKLDESEKKPKNNKRSIDEETVENDTKEINEKFIRIRGQNKNRRTLMNNSNIRSNELKLCAKYTGSYGLEEYKDNIEQCPFGDQCKFSHDVEAYMKNNPVYLNEKCYMFDTYGFCGYGHRCKFGKSHIDLETNFNLIDKDKFLEKGPEFNKSYKNFVTPEIKNLLRKKKYDFSILEKVLGPASLDEKEWKKVDFKNKLYLSPLTTVGNLPFRRICKEFGADITCGEMALAQNIVEGNISEWALLRRHKTEDIFGVQICGSNYQMLTKAVKLINDNCDVDFIDLNMGCPIDLIYQKGAGCGLMGRYNKLSQIITSMTRVSEVPITLKMRAGIYQNKFVADKLINSISNQFCDGRIGLITVHGRSREARYTKSADWNYIRECAISSNEKIPIFGSGDILSYKDYEDTMSFEGSKVSGTMIGRGALIKPWIFTEIKEKRDWDISSSERLEILKKFVNYGLEQWGSDHEGVEKTRKFLLEWLSFLCRYIPVGLLEVIPQKINDRPPLFNGRDDLETLFGSPFCKDWITISEMFLGPVKENFLFLPKHKANAYSN